jgi:hypothetical protein
MAFFICLPAMRLLDVKKPKEKTNQHQGNNTIQQTS